MKQVRQRLVHQSIKLEAWRAALRKLSISAVWEHIAPRILFKLRRRIHHFEKAVPPIEPLSFSFPKFDEDHWIHHTDLSAKEGETLCRLAGCILGTLPIVLPQESHLSPLKAVSVFSALLDIEESARGCIEGMQGCADLTQLVLSCPGIPLEFTDAWFGNDLDLILRVKLGEHEPIVVRAFQHDIDDNQVRLIAERCLGSNSSNLIDVQTLNPLLPILISISGVMGEIRWTTLLPFPSLCRSGIHYGELLASAKGQNVFISLQNYSANLLEAWVVNKFDYMIAGIELDISDAIGSERIFQSLTHDWLATMGVSVALAAVFDLKESTAQNYLENNVRVLHDRVIRRSALQKRSCDRKGGLILRLPASALPSLRALVAKRRSCADKNPDCQIRFIIARDLTNEPLWFVEMPVVNKELTAMLPKDTGSFPSLIGADSSLSTATFPLAVQFRGSTNQETASLIMPFVPEARLIQLTNRSMEADSSSMSVVISFSGDISLFAAFLDALNLQDDCLNLEVIIGLPSQASTQKAPIVDLANKLFFGKIKFVELADDLSETARVNKLVGAALGDFVVIAGKPVLLHDRRALATLRVLTTFSKVASSGCLLIRPKGEQKAKTVSIVSGGYWLSCDAIDTTSAVIISLRGELHFPRTTYPVIANSSSLFVTRREVWMQLGGFEKTIPDLEQAALDYAMRASMQGFTNYCTSAVSATVPQCPTDGSEGHEIIASVWKGSRSARVALQRLLP